jgi:hypothetical protein
VLAVVRVDGAARRAVARDALSPLRTRDGWRRRLRAVRAGELPARRLRAPAARLGPPPRLPLPRTNRTSLVPPPVLSGHAASLTGSAARRAGAMRSGCSTSAVPRRSCLETGRRAAPPALPPHPAFSRWILTDPPQSAHRMDPAAESPPCRLSLSTSLGTQRAAPMAPAARCRGTHGATWSCSPRGTYRQAPPTSPPPPSSRTNRTRRVPHPVLIGHAASLTPY